MKNVLYGKDVSNHTIENLRERVKQLKAKGVQPTFAIVRVGARPDDIAYEKGAISRCERSGINVVPIALSPDVAQQALINVIESLNMNPDIHGILVFRPLPLHIDSEVVRQTIDENKDVDCMHPANEARVYEGNNVLYAPCTPLAVLEILDYYEISVVGKDVVIIGASNVVGKPLSFMLLEREATVTICHIKTKDASQFTLKADIIICAAGVPKLLREEHVREGAIVIDVGINACEDGICGDADYKNLVEKVQAITPVPGGVGSVTSTMLAKQLVKACERQVEILEQSTHHLCCEAV